MSTFILLDLNVRYSSNVYYTAIQISKTNHFCVQGTERFKIKRKKNDEHLQFSLCILAGDGTLNEAIGVGLRGVDFGILAGVLQALVPAQVCDNY
jgi:hypothetical protein